MTAPSDQHRMLGRAAVLPAAVGTIGVSAVLLTPLPLP
jgi:hypothetical protein